LAQLDIPRTRDLLQEFDFERLFLEQLGWTQPANPKPRTLTLAGQDCQVREIARLGGVEVLELAAADGRVPDARSRLAVYRDLEKIYRENLVIFIDGRRNQSLWYWVKRDGAKLSPRDHYFFRHQPGDLFLSKLSSLVIDVAEHAEESVFVAEVARRLREALDVERVTKRFYDDFEKLHKRFFGFVEGIGDERDRRWYASVLLNRLMFVYFLQKKGFLDKADRTYLRNKLEASRKEGADLYYSRFLKLLFFEGLAKPEAERSAEARRVVGDVCYLDGGLFLPHKVEIENPDIRIPDSAFEEIFDLFERYSWNLNDTPGGDDNEINPDVLGYIFERYINQKQFGAYYTRPEITRYLCEKAIYPLILERVNAVVTGPPFETIQDLLLRLNAPICRRLWAEVLPQISILDPACGSGAFLVAALKTLIDVYSVVIGWSKTHSDSYLRREMETLEREHPSTAYAIKKRIITDNLFGVDIMEEATEIAKLRLFLTLVASATRVADLEPLPNIDFNILAGNSLIGLLHVQDEDFEIRQKQGNLFRRTLREVLAEKNRLIAGYRHATTYGEKLQEIRDEVERAKGEAGKTLNDILLAELQRLGVRHEEMSWDPKARQPRPVKRRPLIYDDITRLQPFHWGYEFDQVLREGGFDVILTNPPWEVFKPQAKEFFAEHSEIVTKNKMTIKEFEKEQAKLLRDREVREAWLAYQSRFPHVSQFFRRSADYANQISIVNEKRTGTDINLYKLFLERCFRLLRAGGRTGILMPTGFYSDLGAKRLREMLFEGSRVEDLIGLSNERYLFEGVHHSFRICLLIFQKGGETAAIRAAFRINPREAISADKLEMFLDDASQRILIDRELIAALSPDSLSILEFKNQKDVQVAEKIFKLSLLGQRSLGRWDLSLNTEFHMTNDSSIFRTSPSASRLPLFEGKMIHQFTHSWGEPKYWIEEREARKALLGREEDTGQILDYQQYRLGFRDVARDTDERTMIMTMLPRNVFCNHKLPTALVRRKEEGTNDLASSLFLCGVMNSFVADYLLRFRVTANLTFFIVYQTPVPRLIDGEPGFRPIVERSAQLICTTEEFANLWEEVMDTPWSAEEGATAPDERARLRAELDGLAAHLYGLTEEELAHILSTFPVVSEPVKDAVLRAYRELAPKQGDPEILALIRQGESHQLEFKSTARWDLKEKKKNPVLESVILHTVTAFLNAQGGALLIGIADDGSILGLEPDYRTLGKKGNRDGFEAFLTGLLLDAVKRDLTPAIRTTFHEVDGKDVCRLVISASPRPVFLKEGGSDAFWLRTGNSTRRLSIQEAVEYCKIRWK
jgi:hypothetical protein